MKKSNIKFRKIRSSDYRALEKIISDTWEYDKFCTPKTARAQARLYLASCLANQSFTCVAEIGGEPVGVIMGRIEENFHPKPRYVLGEARAALALLAAKDGFRLIKMLGGEDEVNEALLAESKQDFGGEVEFFAVRGDQCGNGVGKALFARLQAYMSAHGISNFYLYTDTSCNFGFYEHQGMVRVRERKYSFKTYRKKEMSFFLYSYKFA